jgi:hypothetical protein
MGELKDAKAKLSHEVVRSARESGGWPGESDESINLASAHVVRAMEAEHGEAWLGAVNLYGKDHGQKEKMMWRWDGAPVLNFCAHFVAPKYDEELVRLIFERDAAPYTGMAADRVRIDAIHKKLEEIGGALLFWT